MKLSTLDKTLPVTGISSTAEHHSGCTSIDRKRYISLHQSVPE
jgi:hypothetical protein